MFVGRILVILKEFQRWLKTLPEGDPGLVSGGIAGLIFVRQTSGKKS